VVAVARRTLGQRRIGHTGTLDPFATGVLPLACGRATRLVRFMSGANKTYEARVRFGVVTDSYDITGRVVQRSEHRPSGDAVVAAVEALRGEQLQTPPSFSAKRVAGQRAYDLARREIPVALDPVRVHLLLVEVITLTPDYLDVRLTCSAGYYVRSFAHDLGARLGCGACLETLRRTRSGTFGLDEAVTLAALHDGTAAGALIELPALLPDLDGVIVTPSGRDRLGHGQAIGPGDVERTLSRQVRPGPFEPVGSQDWIRVLDGAGALVGVALRGSANGSLHPAIVLI
jgi:tRNA pseudouridine55 synthase